MTLDDPSSTVVVPLILLTAVALLVAIAATVVAVEFAQRGAWLRAGVLGGLATVSVLLGFGLMPVIGVTGSGAAVLLVAVLVLYLWPFLLRGAVAEEGRP